VSSTSRPVILGATKDLISREGPGFSLAEVAAEAGVSRQAVYLHFGSRAGLLVALVRNMDEEAGIRESLEKALSAGEPLEAMRRFVTEWLRFAVEIQPIASTLFAARGTDEAAADAWEDRARELRAGFRSLANRLKKSGHLREGLSAETAADLIWALCSIPVVEQLTVDLAWSKSRIIRETTAATISAVTAPH